MSVLGNRVPVPRARSASGPHSNFEPDGEQYRLTTEALADAWRLRWPAGIDDRRLNPADRIDHSFVSPGIAVRDARFLTGPESDHPALVVDIAW